VTQLALVENLKSRPPAGATVAGHTKLEQTLRWHRELNDTMTKCLGGFNNCGGIKMIVPGLGERTVLPVLVLLPMDLMGIPPVMHVKATHWCVRTRVTLSTYARR